MIKKLVVLFICIPLCFLKAQLNGKIKIYFTNPVNTAVSSGINAVYLNNSMDDTLVEYINRAKYTIDVAVYNYQQSSGMANIAAAINNADARGVVVRWIYDGSQSNSGMSTLNANVHTLGSPTSSAYGIMHNKFMIIDANSLNQNDPLVWTGSTNWTKTHFNSNANNSIIIQDKNLAQAFLTEFNEMWGSSGITPNTTVSKFGPFKTNNTVHNFTIGGVNVELYFSPSDGVNNEVINTINSANSDLYFGMLAFSLTSNSSAIITKKNTGVQVAGIIDQSSQLYTPYSQLNTALGANFKVYSQLLSVYHNKTLIVDPCTLNSDPTVITGSYNWTTPANTENDENAIIIHDASVANIFYQAFHQDFTALGGALSSCVVLNVNDVSVDIGTQISPNPFVDQTTLQTKQTFVGATLTMYNLYGQAVKQIKNIVGNTLIINRDDLPAGIYFMSLEQDSKLLTTSKFIICD